MVTGGPRHIIIDLTPGPSQVGYEIGSMFKLHECSAQESRKLTVFALAKVEYAIAFAIGAG